MTRRPRNLPSPQPGLLAPRSANRTDFAPMSFEIAVVTPLFGGGAVARAADHDLPVRAAAVRGNLRMWWRACRAVGPDYGTAKQLFTQEATIWGSTDLPSAIQIQVEILDPGQPVAASSFKGQRQPGVEFALFPFLDMAQGEVLGLAGVRFRLTLAPAPTVSAAAWPTLRREAEAAVWAWVTLGGIGSRTRRGCGTLFCPDLAPPLSKVGDLGSWFCEQVGAGQHVHPGQRQLAIPVVSGSRLVVGDEAIPPYQAWNAALRRVREMRQEVNVGRNPGQQANRPGRSRWPEPDAVRDLLGIVDPRHRPEHPAGQYFPRADLGLPIIFQRMDRPEPRLEAAGEGMTRFASPLICKPLALSATQAVPLVVCLNTPHVWEGPGVVLKRGDGKRPGDSIPLTDEQLHDAEKSRLTAKKLQEMAGHTNARDAVLAYVARKWGREEVQLP